MKGIGGRVATIATLALTAMAVTGSTGAAASSPAVHTGILGVVPQTNGVAAAAHGLLSDGAIGTATPTTLTFDSSYETLINQYFADVAAASSAHASNNVYSVATQYSGSNGSVLYQSTVGGAYVDKNPLPANGCNDGSDLYCLIDAQLQQEIQAVMAAKGWQGGLGHIFFLMTPKGVGSCADAVSNFCTTNTFCAYHSAFGTLASPVIYANEPYQGHVAGCEVNMTFPNDEDSDTTVNTISHEHNEAVTDPLGTAWWANDGNRDEIGDLCAYSFGTQAGSFNEIINKDQYELQQEYSNQDVGCVQELGGSASPPLPQDGTGPLAYPGHGNGPVMHTNTTYAIYWLPTAGNTSPPTLTGTAAVKRTLTTTQGSWSDAPTGYSIQWQRCTVAGASCVNISGATAATYRLTAADAGNTVRSAVTATNVNGPSLTAAASATTAAVIGSPAATRSPHISGKAKVGKRLTASKGTWTGPPRRFRFQWLRCNGHGGSCKTIGHATKSTYRLTKKDAGHRLRVRVTARNAAGTKAARSRATGRVPVAKR